MVKYLSRVILKKKKALALMLREGLIVGILLPRFFTGLVGLVINKVDNFSQGLLALYKCLRERLFLLLSRIAKG